MTLKERYDGVISYFTSKGGKPQSELNFRDNFSLLVAVMLSAQCTDKRVNMVTPALMEAYPTAEAMSKASVGDVLKYVHSVSYPNAKSGHIVEMSRMLVERFGGEVPSEREKLESLPGVGRKTANVVMAVGFGLSAMPVDTHVFRVSERIGLSRNAKNPLQCEKMLTAYIPAGMCADMHHWLLLHGRYVCMARNPKCVECEIKSYCRYHGKKNK